MNPFEILKVSETAEDDAIQKAYLQQVREHPPEREPERFQTVRAAYEAVKTRRDRINFRLFHQEVPDLDEIIESALRRTGQGKRPSEKQLTQVLIETLAKRRA